MKASCPFCKTGEIRFDVTVMFQLFPKHEHKYTIYCSHCNEHIRGYANHMIDPFFAADQFYKKYNQQKIEVWKNLK
jgi:hypothetical protein